MLYPFKKREARFLQGFLKISLLFFIILSAVKAEVPEQEFQDAYSLYKKNDFKNSYIEFRKLFFQYMDDSKVNFYMGRSALELGDYDMAIAAFERVLILKPEHTRSRLELGRAYLGMKMLDQSEAEFKKVLMDPIPKEVRDAVERYLALIVQSRKKSYLSGMISIGTVNDSNANNGNDYKILALSDEEVNPESSDTSYTATVAAKHIYDFGEKAGFYWQSNALLFNQSYSEYDNLNLIFASAATGPGLKVGGFSLDIPFGIDHLYFGDQNYVDVTHATLKMQIPESDKMWNLSLKKLDRKNLIEANEERDSSGYELLIGIQQALGSSSVFNGEFLVNTERKVKGERVDVDFDEAGLKVGFFNQFGSSFFTNLSYQVKAKKFVDEFKEIVSLSVQKDVERTDINHNVNLSLSLKFLKDYTFSLNGTYMKNDSTYELYSYTKSTVGASVSMQF